MNPSQFIDNRIAGLSDWCGQLFAWFFKTINQGDPKLQEDWKWGTAVWTKPRLLGALGVFKNHLKLNFFKGVYLNDQNEQINYGFGSKVHRAVDLLEDDKTNVAATQDLIRKAAAHNIPEHGNFNESPF